MNKLTAIATGILVVALVGSLFVQPARPISAAPALAVITPVSNGNVNNGIRNYVFFNGAITADTYSCTDTATWDVMDNQYQIDQTTTNTVTLTVKYYNIAQGPTDPVYEDGATIVSANAADAHGFAQVGLFGRWTCILADVTNSNSVIIRDSAVFK